MPYIPYEYTEKELERISKLYKRAIKMKFEFLRETAPTVFILRDGQPVAEFTDASLARMTLLMFQSNEEANGNRQHVWTVEGDQ